MGSLMIYIYMFQHLAKSLLDLMAVSALVASNKISPFKGITTKLATSAGENRKSTTPGTSSPTLLE